MLIDEGGLRFACAPDEAMQDADAPLTILLLYDRLVAEIPAGSPLPRLPVDASI